MVTQSVLKEKKSDFNCYEKKMGNFTAGMLKKCKHSIKELVNKDQGFYFMNQIRGTPVYWKRFQHEVLAMIEQLGCATFFLTLSCADLKWKEFPEIISKLNKLKLPIEYLESMNYFEKCELLNRNLVLLARYFQHHIETFFKETLLIPLNTIGKVTYYAIRIEFQVLGSTHVHNSIWILNIPKPSEETLGKYIEFIDNIIHANLPSPDDDPVLHELVNQYQTHKHLQSCRKYKNKLCRHGFGKFFTEKIPIAQPLEDGIKDVERYSIFLKKNTILSEVSDL